jgi:uncharacterized repeat protein (TIGR03803 family)
MPSTKTSALIGLFYVAILPFLIFPPTARSAVAASTENVLYSFCAANACADGSEPIAGLVFDSAGNLYGTTLKGGAYGYGSVFQLAPGVGGTWNETVLYSFCSTSGCQDGAYPGSGLVFSASGSLFGTTVDGGAFGLHCGSGDCGTVFELTPGENNTWSETVLHSFKDDGKDGFEPFGGLIFDVAGNLYGTTLFGGQGHRSVECAACGTVFELTPSANGTWTETILHNFCSAHGCEDGAEPEAGLTIDLAGNLYGTTSLGGQGGRGCGGRGCGVIFELVLGANGKRKEKILHSFNFSDGTQPTAGLIFDAAGNLYGTTVGGGAHRDGTVFELSSAKNGTWTEKVLASNGLGSTASLVLDSSGNLYGTSGSGGYGEGAIFELTRSNTGKWMEKLLYKFNANGQDGDGPNANLIFDAAGNLYSTTTAGGASGSGCGGNGCGTVFEITP